MTGTQWIWEFEALVQKEKDDTEKLLEVLKLVKSYVVNLLGLNLPFGQKELAEQPDLYMPWAIMGGRREVAAAIIEKLNKEEKVTTDEEFEKLSSAIARGEIGDMDPIISIEGLNLENAKRQLRQEDLKNAGVHIVDGTKPAAHISFDREEMLKRARSELEGIADARKRVNEQMQEERTIARNMSVLFDEDAD